MAPEALTGETIATLSSNEPAWLREVRAGAYERKDQIDKWTEDAKKHWSVDNGELVNDGNGAYLTTDKDFGDIELLIDYKTVALADSGIYLRATPQVQIWDYTKEGGKWNLGADKGSGGHGTRAAVRSTW